VNDEGASMLTFQVLTETASFARDWVPFCKKFDIEPRAPEQYFAIKVDYTKDKKHPDFVKERRAMKVTPQTTPSRSLFRPGWESCEVVRSSSVGQT
jgi:hypothetical protein